MITKTAIVIGATGLIGKSLVQQLAEAQHIESVIAVNRRKVDYVHPKIKNCVVDYADLESYASVFDGDLLFSCLGTTLKRAGSITAQREVDLEYQFRAAELALVGGVSDYFLVSSSGANNKSKSAYLQMKGELEDRVQSLNFSSITIMQPSLLTGDRDHVRVGESIASHVMPLLKYIPGLKKYRPIKGETVAKKMLRLSIQPKSGLHVYRLEEIFVN